MYAFQSEKIVQTLKSEPPSTFLNLKDRLFQMRTSERKKLDYLRRYSHFPCDQLSNSEIDAWFDRFAEEVSVLTHQFIDQQLETYQAILTYNQNLWKDRLSNDLGIELSSRKKRLFKYACDQFGSVVQEDVIAHHKNAPLFALANQYLEVKHSSMGKFHDHCFSHNADHFYVLAGEWIHFRFLLDITKPYDHYATFLWSNMGFHPSDFQLSNQSINIQRLSQWHQQTYGEIEDSLRKSFGLLYTDWRLTIPQSKYLNK